MSEEEQEAQTPVLKELASWLSLSSEEDSVDEVIRYTLEELRLE